MSHWPWIPSCTVTNITPKALHIWRLSLRCEDAKGLWNLLSRDEQERAQRFVRSQDQDKYVQVRGTLRCLLGQYLQVPGQSLSFDYGDYGKPRLKPACNPLNLRFNVSHSHALALIAITQDTEVGIDIELINPQAKYLGISQRFFSADEHDVLMQQPTAQQCQIFFQLWTRKEACIKALGSSIAQGLEHLNVVQGLHQTGSIIREGGPAQTGPLFLQNLFPDPNFAGAVATTALMQHLYRWQWQSGHSD